jgi:hypothetical protein
MEIGDKLTRNMAGLMMPMVVRDIGPTKIVCDAITESGAIFPGGWTFDIATGIEIDDDLEWGPAYGRSGSFIVEIADV